MIPPGGLVSGFCFCTNAPDIRGYGCQGPRHDPHVDDLTDDDLFLDAVDAIVLDALGRLGNDPKSRYALFRRLLAVAQEAVSADGGSLGRG